MYYGGYYMWNYEKRLEYPINIKNPNPALAAMIISQYGGPDGESSASFTTVFNALPAGIFPAY